MCEGQQMNDRVGVSVWVVVFLWLRFFRLFAPACSNGSLKSNHLHAAAISDPTTGSLSLWLYWNSRHLHHHHQTKYPSISLLGVSVEVLICM